MIGYQYRVVAGGQQTLVQTTARAVVQFETEFDSPIAVLASGRVSFHYWLAWRSSGNELDFENWLDTLTDFEVIDTED